ncbi:methyl-accepting chemotaxis protein, partial [Clostridioides difficile]|nr:methyl-accepting chemotaxis protein [Clostridioides difficile]
VRSGADTIATSTIQISAGNQDLSVRTAEQAASLAQTAASMTALPATVRQNAENARQANSLAVSACELAGTGRRDVDVMVETINQINADSARVAEITGMIEGIAFQTNILALNAAVEAA